MKKRMRKSLTLTKETLAHLQGSTAIQPVVGTVETLCVSNNPTCDDVCPPHTGYGTYSCTDDRTYCEG